MGGDTRKFSERYNPGRGDCGPYAVGQLASTETPSGEDLAGYRLEGVGHVLASQTMAANFWVGGTPEEREGSRQNWAERMSKPTVWADYFLMLGMVAVFCSDVIIVQPRFPGDESNRELEAYGEDVLDAGARMILCRDNHFVVLDEVGRGGDGGNGEGNGREPSSSSSSSNNNNNSGSSSSSSNNNNKSGGGSSGGSRKRGRSSGGGGGGGSSSSSNNNNSGSGSSSSNNNNNNKSGGGSSGGSRKRDRSSGGGGGGSGNTTGEVILCFFFLSLPLIRLRDYPRVRICHSFPPKMPIPPLPRQKISS